MARPFYIMHHNPNLVGNRDEKGTAIWALTHGANALAPDVVFWKKDFYVMHYNNPLERHTGKPLFREYLSELADVLLRNPQMPLHLMAFDLKNTDDSPYPFENLQ